MDELQGGGGTGQPQAESCRWDSEVPPHLIFPNQGLLPGPVPKPQKR